MSNEKNPFQDATKVTETDTKVTAAFKKAMSGVVRVKDEIIDAAYLNYQPVKEHIIAPLGGEVAVKGVERMAESVKRGDLVDANLAAYEVPVKYIASKGTALGELIQEGAKNFSNGGFPPAQSGLPNQVAQPESGRGNSGRKV